MFQITRLEKFSKVSILFTWIQTNWIIRNAIFLKNVKVKNNNLFEGPKIIICIKQKLTHIQKSYHAEHKKRWSYTRVNKNRQITQITQKLIKDEWIYSCYNFYSLQRFRYPTNNNNNTILTTKQFFLLYITFTFFNTRF